MLSVALRLLRCLLSKFVSPCRRAIVDAFATGPPSPFAYHCQPLSCRSFTEHQLLLLLPLMVGCCILCHTNHITKLKTFPVSTLWTYFDLLRVSMCLVWCTLEKGNSVSLFSLMTYGRLCDYLISTDSYIHVGLCVGGRSHQHDIDSLRPT